MASTLVDASALVALFGDHEPYSGHYKALIKQASIEHWHLSSTWPCVVEATQLLGATHRFQMLEWVAQGALTIFPFYQEDLLQMLPWMQKYTDEPKTEMDLADASLYWLASETGAHCIMTLDVRDFSRYKLPNGKGFEIL